MTAPRLRPEDAPAALDDRARENLAFIRTTMERAASFTGVPGWGGVAMGLTALAAAFIAHRQSTPRAWLTVWLVEGLIAFLIGAWSLGRKARRDHGRVLTRSGRQFVLSFAPPIFVGAVLTLVLAAAQLWHLLPGVWLLLYGTGIVTGGAFSIRVVPLMGFTMMLIGLIALFAPAGWGDACMAVGFGVVQAGFGLVIARRHGG
jgi:hypothetical protein